MSTFDSTKTQLSELLSNITKGKLQLPDFQRGWVWDDEHIRALLVSVARSFPIGAVMLLETGGEVRFQTRPIESVELGTNSIAPEELILDGQQRLTSLTQVLKLNKAVTTRNAKKQILKLHYYFNVEKALEGPDKLAESIIAVDEQRMVRTDFGRKIELELSSIEREVEAFYFPCSQILNSDEWEQALMQYAPAKLLQFMKFRGEIVASFRNYSLPVIRLKKETSKAAVCLVFEKVNTGGVPLSVFELITATWAADNFNLRDDWFGSSTSVGRKARLEAKRPLLHDLQSTDFLQGISLLHSYSKRIQDQKEGKIGKDVTGVTAKRESILEMPLEAFTRWAEPLTQGFEQAERFLRYEGLHRPEFLPYRAQLVPLAVVLAHLKERWLEPQIQKKLASWFWCGVLGELYGSASETRIALDVQQLLAWIHDPSAHVPSTVEISSFNPNRLDTLRSRNSAAYRGIYTLLQREGARDFFWKSKMVNLDRDEVKLDIHHIFPKKWCVAQGIQSRSYDAIVNKTAIAYKANRMIGGDAPSLYLKKLQEHKQVQISDPEMDQILESHLIDPQSLRTDDFQGFYAARKAALLVLIERAMGKSAIVASDDGVEEDEADHDPEEA